MKFSLLVFFSFVFSQLSAQYTGGLILNDQDYFKVSEIEAVNTDTKGAIDSLPPQFSLKKYCPTPGHQGAITSCVGWSVGYAAMTIQYSQLMNITDMKSINNLAFSPLFIYNQIKLTDCDFGAQIDDALILISEKGNLQRASFDSSINGCDDLPSKEQLIEASKYKASSYYRLFSPEDTNQDKLLQTKKSIAEGKSVIVAMIVNNGFTTLKSGKSLWLPQIGNQSTFGGHALTVIGYDDFSDTFELINSWGKGWGDKGFFTIKYDDFLDRAKYGFNLELDSTSDLSNVMTIHHSREEQSQISKTTAIIAKDQSVNRNIEVGNQENLSRSSSKIKLDVMKFLYSSSNGDLVFKNLEQEKEQDYLSCTVSKTDKIQLKLSHAKGAFKYCYVASFTDELYQLYYPENLPRFADGATVLSTRSDLSGEIVVPSSKTAISYSGIDSELFKILFTNKPILNLEDLKSRMAMPESLSKIEQPAAEDSNFSQAVVDLQSILIHYVD